MHQTIRLAGAVALTAAVASAQFTLTAPDNLYATNEGNSNFVLPWSATGGGRVQFIHDSAVFTNQGVTTPIRITGLRYRADAIANSWSGGTFNNVQLDMSTCPVDHLAVSNTFASNHGPDLTTVLNGPVTVLPGTGGSAPSVQYVDIALTTPFLYDPTTGSDLVVDFTVAGWVGNGGNASGPVDHVGPGANALGSRVWATGAPGPTGGNFSPTLNYSPVCDFVYEPATGLWPNFEATPTTGATPLQVQFTDRSVSNDPGGILLWQWDLDGDTVVDSTARNPTFTYTTCGSYTVSLTVLDATSGQRTLTRQNFIVTDQVEASFTWTVMPGNLVQFTDTTTPAATSWAWDLDGNGTVDSTQQNPLFAYPGFGAWRATLTASRACGPTDTTSLGVVVAPNSLTTTLASNTGTFGATTGALFDVQVLNPAGINLYAITTNPYTDGTLAIGSSITCDVYVTDAAGGYNAVYNNAAAWRLAATGTGVYRGGNAASPVPVPMGLDRPIYLPAGNYGIAVYMMTTGLAVRGGAQTPSNSDLAITAGGRQFGVFSASISANQSFAGTLHYDTLQTGATAGYGFFSAGCAGTRPETNLVATARPRLGSTLSVGLNNLPISAAFLVTGLSRTNASFGALPFDLTPLGAPGCLARVSDDATVLLVGSNNAVVWNLGIPNSSVLVGLQAYNQAVVFDPGFNGIGAVFSDAAGLLVGF